MKIFSVFLIVASSAALAPPAWGGGSVDAGRIAFEPFCRTCHGDFAPAPRFTPYRFNASGLTAAFQAIPAMNGNLTILSTQTINDIATYLGAPDSNDTDRLLNWCEDNFPQVCAPTRQLTQTFGPYTYRFYSTTKLFVATKDGRVFVLDSRTTGAIPSDVGTLRSFLDLMPNDR